jgi:glutamate/aspartate transport system substrate-binding protein
MPEKSLKCALRKAYSGCLKIIKCGQHSFFQIYYPAKIAPVFKEITTMKFKKAALLLAALGVFASGAQAQNNDTLKKIKDSGNIYLGFRESSIPFSYYDDKQQVIGYSYEFALKVVDAVKEKLNLPNLKIQQKSVTSQNRLLLVTGNQIDLECGSTTNNLERQQQVAFSNTIFVISTRLMTKKDSGIKDFADLKGKTVVTTAGTTSERLLRKMNQDKSMGMNIISAKDHGDSFLTLSTGRAVAFMMDDALLAGERAKSSNPQDFVIVGAPQSREAYGCMLRKNDPEFKKVVDDAIAKVETSGEGDKIYKKWFESPIPPKGLNLNFPESDDMKALFKSPNDKAID